MRLGLIIVLMGLALSACQTTGAGSAVAPGDGPVKMTQRAFNSFQAYLKSKDPIAFALSENGKTSSWYYCIEFGCRPYRTIHLAIRQCNLRSNGSPCHLFARQREIVWRDPGDWEPVTAIDPLSGEDLRGRSIGDVEETRLFAGYNRSLYGQKAFAAARAEDGNLVAVGTAMGRLTVRDAMEEALHACRTAQTAETIDCGIVEINNEFVGDLPAPTLHRDADLYVSTALPDDRQTIALLVDWDEVAPAVQAELTYYVPDSEGSFFLRLPDGPGLCKGTLAFVKPDHAAWSMACADGSRAEGTMVKTSADPVYEGKGLDDQARQIRFLSSPPSS